MIRTRVGRVIALLGVVLALPGGTTCRDAKVPAPRPVAAFQHRMRTARTAWVGIDVPMERFGGGSINST